MIVLSKLDAVKNHRITFKINEDIKFSDYNGKYKGTAKVWIKAGNIKKYLDVTYDASPYFEVNPQEVTFKIEATSDPVTTTVHYLTVKPKEPAAGFDFEKKIKVTVKPAMGNYRINFRAINDRAHYNGGNGTDNYEGTLEEKRKRLIMELKEIPTGQMDGLNLHGMRTEFTHLNQTIIMSMSIPRLVRQLELKPTLLFGNLQEAGLVIK